ncbi:hypothetical protein TrVE_jg1438 [Triparma verrucosa]|uniref:Uncharacterized protein n=1 Tax=Triparma verrucosa TaxID=1606542 RepID=A0A9W7CD42_9STRA|nr:hypothetical protein TrVE_jg1438 [Triparma verrucosa]
MAILLLLFLFRSRTVSPFIPQYHRTTFNREIPTSAAAQPENAFGEANPDLFDDADLMGGFDLSKLVDNYAAVGGAVGGDYVKSDVKSENSEQPLNQMSYFYLRDRLDLSESDLWRLTWLGGGVLGLSRAKLGDKLDWFVNVLDFDEEDLKKMVKTQPSVLQLSEKNLESTVKLLHDRLGVTKESLKKMILSYPSILCYSASNLNVKVDFFEEVGMKREKILENPQLMTLSVEGDLWEEEGRGGLPGSLQDKVAWLRLTLDLDDVDLSQIVTQNPRILLYSLPENIIPKVELLDEISEGHADIIILKYPLYLDYSVEGVSDLVSFLKERVNLANREVAKVLIKRPTVVSNGLEKMEEVVTYFNEEHGIPMDSVKKILVQNPVVFSLAISTLREKMRVLTRRFGEDATKSIVVGCPNILNLGRANVQGKLDVLVDYFRTDEAIKAVLMRQPTLLAYSGERLRDRLQSLDEFGVVDKIAWTISLTEEKWDAWKDEQEKL